jgi:hypothetical protein
MCSGQFFTQNSELSEKQQDKTAHNPDTKAKADATEEANDAK